MIKQTKFFKSFCNQDGITIIEVMIAASIGITLILGMYKVMSKVGKVQKNMERRNEMLVVKDNLKTYLSNYLAWENNPEKDIPKRNNKSNFYYYKNNKTMDEIYPLTIYGDEDSLKNHKCQNDRPSCRIAFFEYSGQVYDIKKLKKLDENIHGVFKAVITFETKEDLISRTYLPELKIVIEDVQNDPELRVNPQTFYVNFYGKGGDKTNIDSISRGNCYTEFVRSFPRDSYRDMAQALCASSNSSAPVACFKMMHSVNKYSELISHVTCFGAVNLNPVECFKEAKNKFQGDDANFALLCSGAKSLDPIYCYDLVKEKTSAEAVRDAGFKICSRAFNTMPAQCLLNIAQTGYENISAALQLCPHHKGVKSNE